MCLRGKNKKFLIKRDTKIRNTIKMMKMNNAANGANQNDPSKTSTIQTNLRLENHPKKGTVPMIIERKVRSLSMTEVLELNMCRW